MPDPTALIAAAHAAFDAWADAYSAELTDGDAAAAAAALAAAHRLRAAETAARAADPSFTGYTT